MLASALIALAVVSQLVSGQTAVPPPNTPACLITCAAQSCPDSSLQCLCVDQLSAVTACATASCPPADLTTAAQIATQICAALSNSTTTATVAGTTSTATIAGSSAESASGTATVVTTAPSLTLTTGSASASASASGSSSASASATPATSEGNTNKALGILVLGLAGIAGGFAFF